MKDKSITNQLRHIEKIEDTVEKIGKFLTTMRGQTFVKKLHTASLNELVTRYQAPKFILFFNDNTKNMNMIKSAIKKYNIQIKNDEIHEMPEIEIVKYPVRLTKKEMKQMNARKPHKMGFAALMHAYEEHKMEKFKRLNPAPTELELKQDLFPGELKAGYETKLYIHREYVRNFLCKVYDNIIPKERYYRVFKVYSKNTTRGRVISECEMDRPMIAKQNTSRDELKKKLVMLAKSAKDADNDVIKVKLYDKYGNLHLTHTFIER